MKRLTTRRANGAFKTPKGHANSDAVDAQRVVVIADSASGLVGVMREGPDGPVYGPVVAMPGFMRESCEFFDEAVQLGALTPGKKVLFNSCRVARRDDCRWFEKNPKRTHRLRPPTPKERRIFGDEFSHFVVTQLRPGLRTREIVLLERVPKDFLGFMQSGLDDPVIDEFLRLIVVHRNNDGAIRLDTLLAQAVESVRVRGALQ